MHQSVALGRVPANIGSVSASRPHSRKTPSPWSGFSLNTEQVGKSGFGVYMDEDAPQDPKHELSSTGTRDLHLSFSR